MCARNRKCISVLRGKYGLFQRSAGDGSRALSCGACPATLVVRSRTEGNGLNPSRWRILRRHPLTMVLDSCFAVFSVFLLSGRFANKPLRIVLFWIPSTAMPVVLLGLWALFALLDSRRPTSETVTEVKNSPFKILVRSQEFHHSGSSIVDVCVAETPTRELPKNESQCFLQGYDFDGVSAKWITETNVQISFRCGRVTSFRNEVVVSPKDALPVGFYATLREDCNYTGSKT